MDQIAHIETNLSGKFGVPRQSGVISTLTGRIVFEPDYRNPEALRGLETFSHIWLIWQFSEAVRPGEKPPVTVRPPRLGGNTRMGVFATRSPFRPNNLGLTVVKVESIDLDTPDGPVITVSGVDLMDGTPIFDIKPYLPYADAVPDATGGYTDTLPDLELTVDFPEELLKKIPAANQAELIGILKHDPRPQYQRKANQQADPSADPSVNPSADQSVNPGAAQSVNPSADQSAAPTSGRTYGLTYLGLNVRFQIDDTASTLHVVEISEA